MFLYTSINSRTYQIMEHTPQPNKLLKFIYHILTPREHLTRKRNCSNTFYTAFSYWERFRNFVIINEVVMNRRFPNHSFETLSLLGGTLKTMDPIFFLKNKNLKEEPEEKTIIT